MQTTANEVPDCPKCGGRMWDNRETKRNPKAPDYKCRDRSCDGVLWPPKPGQEPKVRDAKRSEGETRQAYNHPPAGSMPFDAPDTEKLDRLFQLHDVCLDHAIRQSHKLADAKIGDSPEAVSARAAALMIQASK